MPGSIQATGPDEERVSRRVADTCVDVASSARDVATGGARHPATCAEGLSSNNDSVVIDVFEGGGPRARRRWHSSYPAASAVRGSGTVSEFGVDERDRAFGRGNLVDESGVEPACESRP
jgi:hypothetical protein